MKYVAAEKIKAILDVGCGTGKFASAYTFFTKNISGIEMSAEAASLAEENGMKVHIGTLESFNNDQKFDLITMIHVLEHLDNPVSNLLKTNKLLNKNGIIIIATPNINSIERFFFGRYWDNWDTPRHLFLYNTESLQYLLQATGFEIKHILYEENCIINRSLKNYFLVKGKASKKIPVFIQKVLAFFFAICRTSTSLQIIAQKI